MTNFILSGELRISYLVRVAGAVTPFVIIGGWLAYALIKDKLKKNKA